MKLNTNNTQLQLATLSLPIGSLEAYVYRVNQIPILSEAEEYALATKFQLENDLKAAQKLVLAHLKFVVKVAKGYAGYGLSQADLIQEGNLGLMKAVKRFDPKMGVRLVSFAIHWIKAEMHEFILKNWRIVKVATTKAQRKLFFNLRSLKKHLGWLTKQEVKDMAETLNVPTKTVLEMEARLTEQDNAFDGEDDEDSSNAPSHYLEDVSSNPALLLEQSNDQTDSKARLTQALIQLDSRSQIILKKRWLSEKKSTLQELAAEFGVSAERIRQLEQQAFDKLKLILE